MLTQEWFKRKQGLSADTQFVLLVPKSQRLLLLFSALRVYWDTKPSFTPFTPFTTLILLKRNASLLTHGNSNFSLLNFAHSESTECKSSEQAVCPWSELERHLVKHFRLFPVTPSHLNQPQQRAVNAVVARTSSYFYHQFNSSACDAQPAEHSNPIRRDTATDS